MKRRVRKITVYRFRAIDDTGEIRQTRMFAFLPPAKRQAAYWIGRGYEVTLEATEVPVTFTEFFRYTPTSYPRKGTP